MPGDLSPSLCPGIWPGGWMRLVPCCTLLWYHSDMATACLQMEAQAKAEVCLRYPCVSQPVDYGVLDLACHTSRRTSPTESCRFGMNDLWCTGGRRCSRGIAERGCRQCRGRGGCGSRGCGGSGRCSSCTQTGILGRRQLVGQQVMSDERMCRSRGASNTWLEEVSEDCPFAAQSQQAAEETEAQT